MSYRVQKVKLKYTKGREGGDQNIRPLCIETWVNFILWYISRYTKNF